MGLGKTIEAALVLCQYWAERRRNLLIICPASLRKQWAQELQDKFNLPTQVLDLKLGIWLAKMVFMIHLKWEDFYNLLSFCKSNGACFGTNPMGFGGDRRST